MASTIQIAPVTKTLTVAASQAHAFDVFTNGLDRWWPKSHGIGSAPLVKSIIEPKLGGRWYSQHEDGTEAVVGHMKVWEPPSRIVFSWEINAQWKPDPKMGSEVEVRFIAEGPKTTRVELLHHKFETMGEAAGTSMRNSVENGWVPIMDLFKKAAEG
jgi:uncharacterized protein YndB with AHSA1/START domain